MPWIKIKKKYIKINIITNTCNEIRIRYPRINIIEEVNRSKNKVEIEIKEIHR